MDFVRVRKGRMKRKYSQFVKDRQLAEWVGRLVRIPSVSPAQAGVRAGTPGEAAIAQQVATWCKQFGGKVEMEEVLPGRPAVYALWRNTTARRWVAIDVHLDTVGVESMVEDPFSGAIRGGRVHGRGAVDTKASLGVALAMLEELTRRGVAPDCNLLLAATPDEEHGATGAPALARWMKRRKIIADEMIVAEPTNCAPVYGHKGVARLKFTIKGRAAHSSEPSRGRNAITAAAKLIVALEDHALQLGRVRSPVGAPSLTVTLIDGGSGANVVPDRCSLTVDRRLVPGESAAAACKALARLAMDVVDAPVCIDRQVMVNAFHNPPDSQWLKDLAKWSGDAPCVVPFCTNAWAYADVSKQCVVLGPGAIAQAHGATEWVEVKQLQKLASIYAKWWKLKD